MAHLVEVFRHVRRVLSDNGVVWMVLGDSFSNDGKWGGSSGGKHAIGLHGQTGVGRDRKYTGLKPKDPMLVPARVALALQADGWWLRSEVIWEKKNCMPSSVRDRPTVAHEHVFMLAKSPRYFFDGEAIKEPTSTSSDFGKARPSSAMPSSFGHHRSLLGNGSVGHSSGRNVRTIWHIPTKPYRGAHFAVMPEALVRPMILAGTSERGQCCRCWAPYIRVSERPRRPVVVDYEGKHIATDVQASGRRILGNLRAARLAGGAHDNPFPPRVTTGWTSSCACDSGEPVPDVILDPFAGSGTVGVVAAHLGRRAVLIEASEAYCNLAVERLRSGK